MPIPVVVGPAPAGGPDAPSVAELATFEAMPLITLISSIGEMALNPYGQIVVTSVSGFDAPPWMLSVDNPAGWDGARLDEVRAGVREIGITMLASAQTPGLLRALKRSLMRLLHANRGLTTVRVDYADGTSRQITGRWSGGLDGSMSGGDGIFDQAFDVTLDCHDPWWREEEPTVVTLDVGEPIPFLVSSGSFFPATLSSSTVTGEVELLNDGDVDASPVWTITGPGDDLTVINMTTGKSWSLGAVDLGDTITVDCRRGVGYQVVDQFGANQFALLGPNPNLWSLLMGSNLVSVVMSGATTASAVSVSWQRGYLSAS